MAAYTFENLINAILKGDQKSAVSETKLLLKSGADRKEIIIHAVETAMEKLDAKCTVEQFNLLEIMLSGRAVSAVMLELYPNGESQNTHKGKILLAALEGDVHDIGKNILKMVLRAKGYKVIDCGKDCPIDKIISVAREESPVAVGVSGLITTIIPQIRQLKAKMTDHGLSNIKLMAGGAALKQSTATNLNVDYLAQNTFDGLNYLESLST